MKTFAICLAALWLGATLQFGLPERMALGSAKPDFLLMISLCLSLLLPRSGGALAGFVAGVWTGALVGASLAHYALSRTLAAFGVSWSQKSGLEFRTPMAGVAVFAGTIAAQITFMFTAAPRGIGSFLLDTMGSAVVNGVLALPTFALLRLAIGRPTRRSR